MYLMVCFAKNHKTGKQLLKTTSGETSSKSDEDLANDIEYILLTVPEILDEQNLSLCYKKDERLVKSTNNILRLDVQCDSNGLTVATPGAYSISEKNIILLR